MQSMFKFRSSMALSPRFFSAVPTTKVPKTLFDELKDIESRYQENLNLQRKLVSRMPQGNNVEDVFNFYLTLKERRLILKVVASLHTQSSLSYSTNPCSSTLTSELINKIENEGSSPLRAVNVVVGDLFDSGANLSALLKQQSSTESESSAQLRP